MGIPRMSERYRSVGVTIVMQSLMSSSSAQRLDQTPVYVMQLWHNGHVRRHVYGHVCRHGFGMCYVPFESSH